MALVLCAQNPATTVAVDANANRHPINPNIYGVAYASAADMQALNATLNRWGGNATSRYNWQIDAHSAGADWYFETYSDGSGTPGGSADAYVATTRSAGNGAEPLFTVPMIDYIANLGKNRSTLEGFSVKTYGAQTATDPYNSDAGNGVSKATGKNIVGNNPLDTGVANTTAIERAWVQHFVSTFGEASTAKGIKYYILDNEPSLWYSTHRDVHPNPANYSEMYNKIVAYASAIRATDPSAKIVGPEEWSWWAMYFSGYDQANGTGAGSDYATHGNTYYYPWLLQQLSAYKQQNGTSLLDVLTVHCYNAIPDDSDDSLSGQKTRNRETRILWDPTFQDPSWYGDIGINGRVLNWIPTLKAMVSDYYPGLQIGCTEYNWGDEANLNGATTQADVLGIYGRDGFDLATRWTVPANPSPTYLAMEMYRNYDGKRSIFGDTSVSDAVANPDNLSSFAAVRSSDGALTVMVINKQQGSTPVTISLANFAAGAQAQQWQISSVSQPSIAQLANVPVSSNAISVTVPSQSITLFVIPAVVAANNRSFVSAQGSDANNCSADLPCASLAAALAETSPGGEIVILDAGDYQPAVITQPVTITATGIEASIAAPSGNALTINTSGNVTISGLSLHGEGTGNDGVLVQSAGALRLYNVTAESFINDGVEFNAPGDLTIYNSRLTDNQNGLVISNSSARAFVRNTAFDHNSAAGVSAPDGVAAIAGSPAHFNGTGFQSTGGTLVLASDPAVSNQTGISAAAAAVQFSSCTLARNALYAYSATSGAAVSGTNQGSSLLTGTANGSLSSAAVLR